MASSFLPLTPKSAPPKSRILIGQRFTPEYPTEVTVLEWSPSGTRVKLHYSTMDSPDAHSWMSAYEVEKHHILETLPQDLGIVSLPGKLND